MLVRARKRSALRSWRRWAVAPDGAAGSCCHVRPEAATNAIAAGTSRSP
ncbi:hypothetical protein M2169_005827 [Streptomyces sp. MJP52]|nr:hypothetical protein [Streptomyces sp. MJP52]